MKDFGTEKAPLHEKIGASHSLKIENSVPVTAYIVHADPKDTIGNAKYTVLHEGIELNSARVFEYIWQPIAKVNELALRD